MSGANTALDIAIVIPVFNDWECLKKLLEQIGQQSGRNTNFSIYVINDGSTVHFDRSKFENFQRLHVIHLTRNVGHQKAIAIGLSHIAKNVSCDAVIVMDADGEDKPEDIHHLIEAFQRQDTLIFARRHKRHETVLFKLCYFFYKILFMVLVGNPISFGNFCIIPFRSLKKLVHVTEIWNHFPGGVIRSKIPYASIPLDRGKRITGKSRMNFVSLIIHGISSLTAHLDVAVVRLLLFFGTLILAATICGVVVIILRFYTDLAIPGWATYTALGLVMIMLMATFIILNLTMTVLLYRTNRLFIPAIHYAQYIDFMETTGSSPVAEKYIPLNQQTVNQK